MISNELVEFLPWDSDFFACRIGRAAAGHYDGQRFTSLLAACRQLELDCLYLLVAAGDPDTSRLAECHGLRLADIRVTMECRLPTTAPHPWQPANKNIRPARPEDIPRLRPMAAANHRDSRFYQDPHFPRDRCDELYATWIEKSCRGYAEEVLTFEKGGEAAGYISCHLPAPGVGQIGLVGVDSAWQGGGIGSQLLAESLRWFASQGVIRVEVVTQGCNIAAQRLYQKQGFLVLRQEIWFHGWLERSTGACLP